MALQSYPPPALIGDSCLEGWDVIDSGGFGQVYKARHRKWCCDVAVKLLHYDDGKSSSLLREIDMMRQGSSPYVIQVLGVFRGQLPSSGPSTQLGLVMEFMERGSLASLWETLHGPPPWPLVFRLAHQVALGMNFLHNLTPPLLHLDLKPSNVLLDPYLNAKLTDFGLSRVTHSFSRISKKDSEEEGGTLSFMPPEAFDLSYSPTRASDIYSYGILLWSIVTGKQPYANAMSSIIRLRIPQGDRPSMDDIRALDSGIAGLTRLMDLMEKCWQAKAKERPSSNYCTTLTEELTKMHKHAIDDAVHQVLKKLDVAEHWAANQNRPTEMSSPQPDDMYDVDVDKTRLSSDSKPRPFPGHPIQSSPAPSPSGSPKRRHEASPFAIRPNILNQCQDVAEHWAANQNRPTEMSSPRPDDMYDVDVDKTRLSSDSKPRPFPGHPIQSSPSPSPSGSPKRRHEASPFAIRPNILNQYQRQFSTPEPVVNIHCSNVTGFLKGDNNIMNIHLCDRRRHPTAPSSVNVPPPHSGRRKEKNGGVI